MCAYVCGVNVGVRNEIVYIGQHNTARITFNFLIKHTQLQLEAAQSCIAEITTSLLNPYSFETTPFEIKRRKKEHERAHSLPNSL